MKKMKLSVTVVVSLLATSHQLAASESSRFVLTHFDKGCLMRPLNTTSAFKYFESLPGYKAWGPERNRKAGTNALGAPVEQMRGIFMFRNASKTKIFSTLGGFGDVASCVGEFKPDLSWDAWVKEAESMIKRQKGFSGSVAVKKGGKIREYTTSVGVFRIVNFKNKKFQIQIAHK